MKNLVIFYSLEGNTKLIAKTIAEEISGDVLELVSKKKYHKSGFKKFFWGGKSIIFNEKPEIMPIDKKIEDYDNIFIGTPIWVGTYAPPIKTLLENYNISNKNIGLFACHGGGGASKFYNNIKKEIPNNKFLGEIDFCDPLKKDTEESIKRAIDWASKIITM